MRYAFRAARFFALCLMLAPALSFPAHAREDGGADYGLRYEELTALCIRQIQKLAERVKRLEGEV